MSAPDGGRRDRAPAQARTRSAWPATMIAVSLTFATAVLCLRLAGVRLDIRLLSYPQRFVTPSLLTLGGAALVAIVVARRRGSWVLVAAAAIAIVVAGMLRPGYVSGSLVPNLGCGGWELAVALPLVVVMLLGRRASKAIYSGAYGATLAAAGCLGGAAMLHLHCVFVDETHVLVVHVGALAVAALVGQWLARKLA